MPTAKKSPTEILEQNSTIKLNYYQITDALPELISELQAAAYKEPGNLLVQQELEIFTCIQEHIGHSELGRIL